MAFRNATGIFITLLLILLIPGINGEDFGIDDWNTYNDSIAGFSINYPGDLNLFFSAAQENRTISFADLNNITVCTIVTARTNATLSTIRVTKEKLITGSGMHLNVSASVLGSLPAVQMSYAETKPGSLENTSVREIFAIKDSILISIRSESNPSSFEKNNGLVQTIEDSFVIIPVAKNEKYWEDGIQTSWYSPGIVYDQFGIPYTAGYGGWYPLYGYPVQSGQINNPEGYYYPGVSGGEGSSVAPYNYGQYSVEPTGTPSPSYTSCDSGSSYQDATPTPTPDSGTDAEGNGNGYGSYTSYPEGENSIEPTNIPTPTYTSCDTVSPYQDETLTPTPSQTSGDTGGESDIRALVVIAPQDYNEEELAGVTGALHEKGIKYDITSIQTGPAKGMAGEETQVSLSLDEVKSEGTDKYNGIILIGGEGAMKSLYDDQTLRELVKAFDQNEKLVSAICASPVVLSRAGILQGKTVTLFGDPQGIAEVQAAGATVREDESVITDGRIITGNGPSAAIQFGETVASALQK